MTQYDASHDTRVTISCDRSIELARRLNLLTFIMAESLQGAELRTIVRWDVKDGEIEFIKRSHHGITVPRGEATIRMEDANGNAVEITQRRADDDDDDDRNRRERHARR